MHSVHQPDKRENWRLKGLVYSVSALVAAAAFGAFLGFLGAMLPVALRAVGGLLFALASMLIGTLQLLFARPRVIQFDRETPRSWLYSGPYRWAVLNGSTLGVGLTTRIAFWLFYAIPIVAVLCGSPVLGALTYGVYGGTRGFAVWPMLYRSTGRRTNTEYLSCQRGRALMVTNALLIAVGAYALLALGL